MFLLHSKVISLFLPSLHQLIYLLLSVDKIGVDDLPVDEGGAPCGWRQEPNNQQYFAFIVKWKPKTTKNIHDLLRKCEDSKNNPVCHPMNIILKM